jgi:hypothetical protein
MGETHSSAAGIFPGRPSFGKSSTTPQLKLERGGIVSILLGKSPDEVAFFNRNIIKIERLK